MNMMEKFFELFRRDLKTSRLELCVLQPTPENAEIVWNAIKNENPDDYIYMSYTMSRKSSLPESVEEVQQLMKRDFDFDNGCTYYIFHDDNFVGYMRIHYWYDSSTLQCASVWFIKSARGKGFNQEIHNKLEDLAFNGLQVNRICRQTMSGNIKSKKSIEAGGYHLDGIDRQANRLKDGTFMDHLLFSKLACEYKKANK